MLNTLSQAEEHIDLRGSVRILQSDPIIVVETKSIPDVIRGLHWAPYERMINVVQGAIFDVVIDTRLGSQTFGQVQKQAIKAEFNLQVHVPAGCLHGFYSFDHSTVIYTKMGVYEPECERRYKYHKDSFGVEWPSIGDREYIMSEDDKNAWRVWVSR